MFKRRISLLLVMLMLSTQFTSGIGFAEETDRTRDTLENQLTEIVLPTEPVVILPGAEEGTTQPEATIPVGGEAPTTEPTTELSTEQPTESTSESVSVELKQEVLTTEAPMTVQGLDLSVVVTEEEMKAAGTGAAGEFFLVKYADGTREIRRMNGMRMSALAEQGQNVMGADATIKMYDSKPEVEFAEPMVIFTKTDAEVNYIPNDPKYINSDPGMWGIKATRTDLVYGRVPASKLQEVVVAVIDTGVDYSHQDLNDAIMMKDGKVLGKDFVNGDTDPMDDEGHGTHVAGTIAAEGNNGMGIVGIADGVKIMPIKVLDSNGDGWMEDVAEGIKWAADNEADIINMSLSSRANSKEIQDAVDYAYSKGVTVVAASGNDASNWQGRTNYIGFPAACNNVIAVGAVYQDTDGKCYIAGFSNSGPELDLVAPGYNILSTTRDGNYEAWAGTSMASPHVAAAAALLKAQNHGRTPAQIEDLLKSKAQKDFSHDDIYGGNTNIYGFGLVDTYSALGLTVGSSECRLKGLTIKDTPLNFKPDTKYYAVNTSQDTLYITPEGFSETQSAWIKVGGGEFAGMKLKSGSSVKIPTGVSHITIRSFGEDNKHYTDYIIEVRNGYQTNGLMSLSILSPAFSTWLLTPAFQTDILGYRGSVRGNVDKLEMVASAAYANSSLTVNGKAIASDATFTVNLAAGLNRIVIAVKDAMGTLREYILNIMRFSNHVDRKVAVPANETLDGSMAPVLKIYENNVGDFKANPPSGEVAFRLSLDNATWTTGSEVYLESVVPDVNLPELSYTVTFQNPNPDMMLVSIKGYRNMTNEPISLEIPLVSSLKTGVAGVNIDPMDTNMPASYHPYAEGKKDVTWGTTISTDGKVIFESNGYANLKNFHIVENCHYSIMAGRKVSIEIVSPGYTFESSNGKVIFSGGFEGRPTVTGGFKTGVKEEFVIPFSPTEVLYPSNGEVGKISFEGIRIKGTPGAVLDKLELRIYGKALESEKRLDVAYYKAPASTQPSAGGGGGGGGGGNTTEVLVNGITRVELPSLTMELPVGVHTSNFWLKTSMTSFVGLKLEEGTRILSDMWSIQPDGGVTFGKPCKLSLSYSASKVDSAKETVSLYWLDEKTKQWQELDGITVENGKVTGTTQKHGIFALLVKPKTAILPVEPVALGVPTLELKDIKGHWAEGNIAKLMGKKAISGNPDGTFQPEKQVSRAEFITMLVKALELKGTTDKTYPDLKGHWAEETVKIAVANGVLSGFEDGTIRPDALITREQMAVMIFKAAKLQSGKPEKLPMDEATISSWAKDSVLSAMKGGIISGYADNTFRPGALATKAEAVTIIARCIK